MFQFSLFSSFLLISYIHADPYTCNGEHLVDPPNDMSTAWYYPDGWKETDQPQPFAVNQTCIWKINVPKGMFAFLTITAATNSTTLKVIDSVGSLDWVPGEAYQEPYFLLNPQFTIYLDNKGLGDGTFGMKVIWSKIDDFNPSSEPVLPNTVPIVKSSGDCDNGLLIYSSTNVSLVSILPPSSSVETRKYMRNTVVFDGRTMNDKLIGNLWQIYELGNHIVSSGQYLTLYSFISSVQADTYAIIQDYQNVKQYSVYKGVSCFNDDLCPVIIDARNGVSAAIRMSSSPHFLENIYLIENSLLSVFTGIVEPSHQVAQYTKEQGLSVAQKFNGLFTTYVLDTNVAVTYLSSDNLDANWTKIIDGRTGVLASKNFAVSSLEQNIQETFTGPSTDIYNIKLDIKNTGLTDDATLTVTVSLEGNPVFDKKYSSKQLPPASINANGNGLMIKYDTNGSKTTGTLIDFSFQLESSSATTISTVRPPSGSTPKQALTTKYTPNPHLETTTKTSTTVLSFFPLLFLFLHLFSF